MSATQNLFEQAQLAEAAYADLTSAIGSQSNLLTALNIANQEIYGGSFSLSQATEFVANWRVVDQYDNSLWGGLVGTGFSATIFERLDENGIGTGIYSLAIRGSQDSSDFIADTKLITADGIAVSQMVDMYNYWQYMSHTGEYQVAKLATQTLATSFLTGLYTTSSADIASEIINLFTGADVPTTYDAARSYFVNHGYIVEGGTVYKVESDLSHNIYSSESLYYSGKGTLAGKVVSVEGHSLGGHLAMAFERLFPEAIESGVGSVLAVNGLGFKVGDYNVYNLYAGLRNLSGMSTVPGFDASSIQNVYGIAGYEFAAMNNNILLQPGGWDGIFIENEGISTIGGHSATQMTDSLAVYDLFFQLDAGLAAKSTKDALAYLTPYFEKSSNQASQSLENMVSGLSEYIFGARPAIVTDERESLYVTINNLNDGIAALSLSGKFTLTSPSSSAESGRADFSVFLGLYYLTPFTLKPNDGVAVNALQQLHAILAEQWNADNALTAEQRANGEANYSDHWLEDRAAMLSWIVKRNAVDAVNGDAGEPQAIFIDNASNTTINVGTGTVFELTKARYIFGDQDAEILTGGEKADHLYGGRGADELYGQEGSDWLEGGADSDILYGDGGNDWLYGGAGNDTLAGGAGNDALYGGDGSDTYIINADQGADTLVDSDGQGSVRFEDHNLAAMPGRYRGPNLWQSEDGNVTYLRQLQQDGSATLRISGTSGSILFIKNFVPGKFGIQLDGPEQQPDIQTNRTINGDFAPYDFDPATDGVQSQVDDLGNVITDPNTPAPSRADTLYDSAGNDTIISGNGDDRIYATRGGDDVIEAESGRDYADGGMGGDQIEGGDGADILSGGEGNDLLYAAAKIDLDTALASGNALPGSGLQGDWLAGGTGEDMLFGSTSNDVLTGGAGADLILGGAGDDDILGDSEWVAYSFDWTVTTEDGSRLFSLVTGNPIPQESGADVIYAGAGNDYVWAGQGNDVVSGEDGNDQLSGNGGNDIILGGAGDDLIQGDGVELSGVAEADQGDDWVDGGAGNDTIHGRAGNDTLMGGDDNDKLYGQEGDDLMMGNSGSDELAGGEGHDTLQGGDGDDILYGQEGNDLMMGDSGNDHLAGGEGTDTLRGGDGDDELWGDDADRSPVSFGDDWIEGGDGNDQINAAEGDDTVFGDAGNDYVKGGEGGDLINGGDGNDNLWGDDGNLASNLSGNDTINGGAGNDQVIGEDGNDLLHGEEGDDTLWGMSGNDTLDGGIGLDYFEGGAGNDTYIFKAGDGFLTNNLVENIVDTEGSNTLQFGDGIISDVIKLWSAATPGDYMLQYSAEDYVYLSASTFAAVSQYRFADGSLLNRQELMSRSLQTPVNLSNTDAGAEMVGSQGGDTLNASGGSASFWGGRGSDTLVGSGGNNIYYYNIGDGTDHIIDTSVKADVNGNPTLNRLIFGSGIAVEDIKLGLGSLRIQVGSNAEDAIHIEGFNPNDALSQHPIDLFEFSDGTVLTYAQLLELGFDLDGTSGNDALVGTSVDDRINGQAGDDMLSGQGGADIYSFGRGSGNDVIADGDPLIGSGDMLGIRPDVNVADISLRRSSNDLVLSIRGSTDSITLRDYLVGGVHAVETIYFESDGTVWDNAAVNLLLSSGNSGNDVLSGSAGNDTLDGGTGEDVLAGNAGDDTLFGGADNDTYLFNTGWGKDVIWEEGDTSGDVIKFGSGISPSDIIAVKSAADLMLYHSNGVDQIKISNWYTSASYRISRFEFADGTSWTTTEVHDRALVTLTGTNGDNSISGTSASETIYGLAGNDVLNGGSGNDVLIGGKGNDTLIGSSGSNTYIFAAGDGADSITGSGNDSLRFSLGIRSTDIAATREGENLVLRHINGTDSVTVLGWYSPSANRISNVIFEEDGTVWQTSELTVMATDIAHSYTFNLGMGAKTVEDWGGIDSLVFGNEIADADIEISRVSQDLNFRHVNGSDSLTIKDWFNDINKQIEVVQFLGSGATLTRAQLITPFLTITGTSTDDNLQGGNAYGESLYGMAGNDAILGGGGDDQIIGGAGNDYLDGGVGADTYYFNQGDGQDIVAENNYSYTNTLIFGSGLLSTLTVSGGGSGQDTTYSFGNGADKVIVKAGTSINVKFVSNGSSASEVLNGVSYGDVIHGLGGADTIYGNQGDDLLYGDDGNDTLIGGAGTDYLYGGSGDDILDGYSLNGTTDAEKYGSDYYADYYYGGLGNDALNGNISNDNYYFDIGDGKDSISEGYYLSGTSWIWSSADYLHFGAGVSKESVTYSRFNEDLIVQVSISDSITIKGWFTDSKAWIDYFSFANGDVVGASTITRQALTVFGTPQNDVLTGHQTFDDVLYGNGGDDNISGQGGNDQLFGGDGNDYLDGSAGSDEITGGKGNDVSSGGSEGDRYFFSRGDGQDVVFDSGGEDFIYFDETVSVQDLTTQRSANDLLLINNSSGDQVTLKNYFGRDDAQFSFGNVSYRWTGSTSKIERVIVANGSLGDISMQYAVVGTGGMAPLTGSTYSDQFYGHDGGADVMYGLAGDDSMYGRAGDDYVDGGDGSDAISGDDGNDTLFGGLGIDFLEGLWGNDALKGGGDFDYLIGGYGSDNYYYDLNDGDDDIYEYGEVKGIDTDQIVFGSGIQLSDISFSRSSNDLNINVGNDYLTVKNQFSGSRYGIENLVFANGSTLSLNDIQIASTAGTLTGTSADSILIGSYGADTLNGNGGNDWLDGSGGIDTISGGLGNDIYFVDDVKDVVSELSNEGLDTINAYVTYTAAANVENLYLAESGAINATDNALNNFLKGNVSNNTLNGSGGNDILMSGDGTDILKDTLGNNLFHGGTGADTITGAAGNEFYIGGTGNDIITTGDGADVIAFNKGGGQDTINVSTGSDNTISLGGSFSYSELSLSKSGKDLILKVGASDQITLKNWYMKSVNRTVVNLQVIAEAMSDFDAGAADPLRNNKVETFNFLGLVSAFDAAGAPANWQLTDARLTAYLGVGSDTVAIGGDLAYQYGRNSSLAGMGLTAAQTVLGASGFGQSAQTLNSPSVWQTEAVKLA